MEAASSLSFLPLVLLCSCSNFSDRLEPLAPGNTTLCASVHASPPPPAVGPLFLLRDLVYWPTSFLHSLLHSGWALPWMGMVPFVWAPPAPTPCPPLSWYLLLFFKIGHFYALFLLDSELLEGQNLVQAWVPGACVGVRCIAGALGRDGWLRTLLTCGGSQSEEEDPDPEDGG